MLKFHNDLTITLEALNTFIQYRLVGQQSRWKGGGSAYVVTTSTVVESVYFHVKKLKDDLGVAQEVAIHHVSKLPWEVQEATHRRVLAIFSKCGAFMSNTGVCRSC